MVVIPQAFIIFLLVLSIHYTMQPGEIFSRLGLWFGEHLPERLKQPVYACNVCMTPWYGTVLYYLIYGGFDWVVIISAMGMQVALNKLSPKK